ncbi:hypothetical protein CTA2_1582 [Colletotrichum tanaceti]|uniref:Transmembrane protein n=1 Tax=Colletotrichum tanaceti TaxID=1306861 RepID=A0A4U6X3Y6_9PEZI|nr:hypothetical protein CTA2_1582 [Colletotrichum tanaceti]TKW49489.1 hypothetical protein CTA1_9268 [Colletotrichum tanaceti]
MAVLSVPSVPLGSSGFTYLPILPLSSTLNLTPDPTFTILAYTQTHAATSQAAISQVGTTLIRASQAPSMTANVVGLGPRVASYTTIYVTTSPSGSSAPEKPRFRDTVYGDLTWSYIVLLCVPFVVLGIALYSNHRDRRRRPVVDEDIEMQPYKKYWFPWRELDPGEVPNEVSSSNPPVSNSGAERCRLSCKGGRNAWHPSRRDPMPPVTLYENPPSWGRRHSWWDVVAYPSRQAHMMPERKRQAAAAAADRRRRNDQIYGRTGSRRNAGLEDDFATADSADSDNDSTAANTGRFSPDIKTPKNRDNGRIDDVRDCGSTNNQSPNPWNTHIPSYYGDFPFPVSPVSASSPSTDTVAGPSSNNAGETKTQVQIQAQAQARAQTQAKPPTESQPQTKAQAPIRRRTERVRSRFDFPSSSSDEDDAAAGQPAEPQKQQSYYADPRTRAGKQPVKP